MSRTIKKDYPKKFDARHFDWTCRNHGSCAWCRNGRLHNNKRKESAARLQVVAYKKGEE
jgi:hypothetical protein